MMLESFSVLEMVDAVLYKERGLSTLPRPIYVSGSYGAMTLCTLSHLLLICAVIPLSGALPGQVIAWRVSLTHVTE